ncbi:peptidoglycan-binding protein [Kitasatospora sp. NPDC059646]|uniref:peptidoglycan-binding protein n=1 Tax=Kitasatospora sp. NPDC059646 TaxID=3346893 RepID=UPI00369129EA
MPNPPCACGAQQPCRCTAAPFEQPALVRPYVPPARAHDVAAPLPEFRFPEPRPATALGTYAIGPAPAVRRTGAHRHRPRTLRRTALVLASSGFLAMTGCGLGATLLSAPTADRADPPRLPAVTLDPEPSATPGPGTGTGTGTASASPTGPTGRPGDRPSTTRRPTLRATPPAARSTPSAEPPAARVTAPPPATTALPSPTASDPAVLRYGDSGPAVRRLQLRLLDLACAPPGRRTVSGTFDDWTRAVLTAYQRTAGIRGEDGVYGPATRAALAAAAARC